MRALWLSLLLTACTGTDDSEPGDGDADTDADTDSDTDADTDTDVEPMGSITGKVLTEGGSAVANARVNICRTVCKTQTTAADGSYTYDTIEALQASFYVHAPAGSDLVDPLVTLTPTADQLLTLDVYMFEAPAPKPLPATAAEVEVAPGLFLTLGKDTLEPAFGLELGDTVAGVAPPLDKRLPIEVAGDIVAVWHLAPFEAEAEAGIPIRVANTFGLLAGDTVTVWAAGDPTVYAWLDAGTLVVTGDGLMLEGDAELPLLSTVALVKSGG